MSFLGACKMPLFFYSNFKKFLSKIFKASNVQSLCGIALCKHTLVFEFNLVKDYPCFAICVDWSADADTAV